MNSHKPNLYTEELWTSRRLREYETGSSIWSVVIWVFLMLVVVGIIGSWFMPH